MDDGHTRQIYVVHLAEDTVTESWEGDVVVMCDRGRVPACAALGVVVGACDHLS